ncbi:MAG: queuine tRNA-ribosyltransferase family protein [Oligoflexia bacterium]|nr:queuine tRNA-ribosyltransferase family protein [Oligoflexia bacterium]
MHDHQPTIIASSPSGATTPTGLQNRNTLQLKNGELKLPVYLPDATHGFVKGGLDTNDLHAAGIHALMMNAFCLMEKPGTNVIRAVGGLHKLLAWDGPIITDSGGFQTYSIIRQNKKFGTVTDSEIVFRPAGDGEKVILSPEKVIQKQFRLGSDVMFCLDECTHASDDISVQERSVKRTVEWARRSRAEYDRLLAEKEIPAHERPLLFAIVQGGNSHALRKACAEALIEIGFDGYGFGGWPLDEKKNLLVDVLQYVRSLIPAQFPLHALGIGHPHSVTRCADMNYGIFDCAMPTKDARNGRLYVSNVAKPSAADLNDERWFSFVYIDNERYRSLDEPLSPNCTGMCCKQYSAAALHYLHAAKSDLYARMATIHNLRFMADLAGILQTTWRDKR